MLKDTTISWDRAWNTWSARPAEMVYLPLGVRVTPLAYSSHLGRATLFPMGPEVRLEERTLDGSCVNLSLSQGGTRLDWAWRKQDPFTVVAHWHTRTRGEWGLRYWLNLCLSAEGGETVQLVEDAALVRVGTRYVALCASHPPVQVTGHMSLEGLAQDYEDHGYFHLATRATEAPVLALRFNLEMMPDAAIAAAVADDADLAIGRARSLVLPVNARTAAPASCLTAHSGQYAGALDAIRDVMAWNGVYDEVNRRPYTCISRNWNQRKFGGFGVWLNDQFFHTLATSLLDAEVARDNLAATLANATPQGNLACLVTASDAWVDRSMIPIGAFIVRLLFERLRDRSMVSEAYDTLARNHGWWWTTRDPLGGGLLSYGTSAVGQALYAGTSFGARNESCMDNSPVHDEAQFDPATRTLTAHDVGLNSLLVLDAQSLGVLARLLGRTEEAQVIEARGETLRLRIQSDLWDPSRRIFANRLRDGRFVRSLAPTSFYPMLCGAANDAQLADLCKHLDDPATFAGRFALPSVARDDPAFADNSYWRGRIWPPLNLLVWYGLRRNGFAERASRLARDSFELFSRSWRDHRLCPENFNADSGDALDQPDTESLYGWGVLMPLMAVAEIMDVNVWNGWEINNEPEDVSLGPLQSPAGPVTVTRAGGRITVRRGSDELLSSNVPGRIVRIRLEEGLASLDLPPDLPPGSVVELPAVIGRTVLLCQLGDIPLAVAEQGTIALPTGLVRMTRTLTVVYR